MLKLIFLFLPIFLIQAQNFPLAITEIMYNPEGNDLGREWIEVLNQSNQILKIISGRSGWRINDGKNHLFEEELIVYPQEVFVIVQDRKQFLIDYPNFKGKLIQANFSLKNETGTIQIFDEKKNLMVSLNYDKNCGGYDNGYSIIFIEGKCYENKIKGGTPGESNYQLATGDSQQATDDSEPGQNVVYNEIKIVQDKIQTSSEETKFQQNQEINQKEEQITQKESSENILNPKLTTIIISEFLPNPEGSDLNKEFIELYNYGDEEIDLDGFFLEFGNKKIKLSGTIQPREYFLITNKDYDFSIRNNGETLNLYFQKEKIFSINYSGKAP